MVNKKKITIVKFSILIAIVVFSLIILLVGYRDFKSIEIRRILYVLKENKLLATVVFLVLFAIKPILIVIPASAFSFSAGMLFGATKGFVLTMIGFFLSGTMAFYLARFLGREFIEFFLGKKMIRLDDTLEKNGFKILFAFRLPPIIPYDPLSYVCGLTKIRYKNFILASVIGVMPETLCYALIGKNIRSPLSFGVILPLILLVGAFVLSKKLFSKKVKSE